MDAMALIGGSSKNVLTKLTKPISLAAVEHRDNKLLSSNIISVPPHRGHVRLSALAERRLGEYHAVINAA